MTERTSAADLTKLYAAAYKESIPAFGELSIEEELALRRESLFTAIHNTLHAQAQDGGRVLSIDVSLQGIARDMLRTTFDNSDLPGLAEFLRNYDNANRGHVQKPDPKQPISPLLMRFNVDHISASALHHGLIEMDKDSHTAWITLWGQFTLNLVNNMLEQAMRASADKVVTKGVRRFGVVKGGVKDTEPE